MPTTTSAKVETVVDAQLDKLVSGWATAGASADKSRTTRDSTWLAIADYATKNKVTKDQLKRSLIRKGGLSEKSVGVEISRLYKFQKDKVAAKLLEKRLKGDADITISQLRSVSSKRKGSDEVDRSDDAKLVRKLMSAIKFAQKTFSGFASVDDFVPFLDEAFRKVTENKAGGANGADATEEEQLATA